MATKTTKKERPRATRRSPRSADPVNVQIQKADNGYIVRRDSGLKSKIKIAKTKTEAKKIANDFLGV